MSTVLNNHAKHWHLYDNSLSASRHKEQKKLDSTE